MPAMHWIRPHIALAPLPGRFVSVQLVERDDPGREAVEAFIADVYRDRYGAVLRNFFPHLIAYRDSDGRLAAAVGIRAGAEGPLFVEHYLDGPVEHAMTRRGIAHVDRRRVVEVGNFAATSPGIARELILQLALTLQAALLVRAGCQPVAEAFIASRLGDRNERHYGALPRGLALEAILERANPDLG